MGLAPAFPTQIHYTHTVNTSSAPHSTSPSLHRSSKAHGIVPSPHHGHFLPSQQPAPVPAAAPAVPWAPCRHLLRPRWALLKVLARLDMCAWGHTCCIRPGVHSASPIPPAASIQRCCCAPQCGSGWESISAVLREAVGTVGTVCPGMLWPSQCRARALLLPRKVNRHRQQGSPFPPLCKPSQADTAELFVKGNIPCPPALSSHTTAQWGSTLSTLLFPPRAGLVQPSTPPTVSSLPLQQDACHHVLSFPAAPLPLELRGQRHAHRTHQEPLNPF